MLPQQVGFYPSSSVYDSICLQNIIRAFMLNQPGVYYPMPSNGYPAEMQMHSPFICPPQPIPVRTNLNFNQYQAKSV